MKNQSVQIIPTTPLFGELKFIVDRFNKFGIELNKGINNCGIKCVKVWFEDERQSFWFPLNNIQS